MERPATNAIVVLGVDAHERVVAQLSAIAARIRAAELDLPRSGAAAWMVTECEVTSVESAGVSSEAMASVE